ncbi:MAG: DEAD/DEAH box helicase [Spirochaetes bacterium]|jgi:ATP-dependent Lhr-like helicase|nr:DEAD/DEAH box helicase [Spirochaetota bacterium]
MNENVHSSSLASFHPLIRKWFEGRFGAPTPVQAAAWTRITSDAHVLVTAPTGSGKTLAAFLWGIDRMVSGSWSTGQTRVLYVSPLRALNNDIRRNLIAPLGELAALFTAEHQPFPSLQVLTRSGDTPADERRRMLRRPPEILITTPESLNILLTSKSGRRNLAGVTAVILDEIHAVAGTKRGTHLMTAVERLVLLSGEFQRIALSATVRPLDTVAAFVGGYRPVAEGADVHFEPRRVLVIDPESHKRFDVRVSFPENARERMTDDSWWPALVADFKNIIHENRSTLFFTNSRRTAEKLARLINENEPAPLAYSHHGSLSRELRLEVESKLKKGELRAIVATSSLELGIDIGDLDCVVLVQAPFALSSAVQRIGRAGHGVGQTSLGVLYPTHGMDFLFAAVTARAVLERDIEPVRPVEGALDVLAQAIVSMCCAEEWDIDRLYAHIRTAWPYRDLPRRHFDMVLEMLAGRYAETRLRELSPRVSIDRIDNTVRARQGAPMLVYLSGGTIPDRGYFDLRVQDTRARIGELDEEFVWERRVGESFALGAQVWRIQRITHNDVEVVPTGASPGIIPFWRAEEQHRDFHFAEKIALFLQDADKRLDEDGFTDYLTGRYMMDAAAARELADFLRRQKVRTGAPLPHRRHLLIEHFEDPLNTSAKKQVLLHTMWGGRVNQPLAHALSAAWEERFGHQLEVTANNECVMLLLPHAFSKRDLLDLLPAERIEELLRGRLEKTGFFGARFRENAGRALLLPRGGVGKRLPLWLNRLRSRKLLETVMDFEDFPILLETWRTCLRDEFDIATLKALICEVREGEIEVSEVKTSQASPFAGGLIWQQTNDYMYQDDTPGAQGRSRLSDDLLREIAAAPGLRPDIPAAIIFELEAKLHRTAPGYAPATANDLLDWLRERLIVPASEWDALLAAVARDHGMDRAHVEDSVRKKIRRLTMPGASVESLCALEILPLLAMLSDATAAPAESGDALPEETEARAADLFSQWLSFYGPVRPSFTGEVLGLSAERLDLLLADLSEERRVAIGHLTAGSTAAEICDQDNLERLLRMLRRSRRAVFKALPIERLQLFMAVWQGLTEKGNGIEAMQNRLDQLFGWPAPAAAWEEYILPARLDPYHTSWLDNLMQTSELAWAGCGAKKITFCFQRERDLFLEAPVDIEEALALIPSRRGRYPFMECARHSGIPTDELTDRLWDLAWKGIAANDGFHVVRSGARHGFSPFTRDGDDPRGAQAAFHRWESTRPMAGNWFIVPDPGGERDEMEEEELRRDRVRALLRRYGVLFRELLERELPLLRWSELFRTLRLMELSGEILAGQFFEGVPGLQFASHEAYDMMKREFPDDAVYRINAADPASLCGLKLEALKGSLSPRLATTGLVFHGCRPVLVARKNGATLEINAPPDSPHLHRYLAAFKSHLGRQFNAPHSIRVETVNDKPAASSEYAPAFKDIGFITHYRGLELRKRY